MSAFNVNEYWLERGRNYMQENRTPPEFHRLQERFLLDVLRRSGVPMRRVLELGCGFGRITRLLAETWPKADITALDLSPEQLTNARRYCRDCPTVFFRQYDFYSGQPLPGGDYDAVVAIEVFLHHPPEVVVQLFKRLAGAARHIMNIDWSEDWPGPLPEHVWVHDYAKLFAEVGLKCAAFALPEKVDGKQQKLFIAARELSKELRQAEHQFREQTRVAISPDTQPGDDWTRQLQLATKELCGLIPAGGRFILVDEAQWGNVRELAGYRVIPFLEEGGRYWGPPADDDAAIRELERQKEAGASHIAFAWPSFWWLDHYAGLRHYLRSSFPCVLENERLVVFRLKR
jgi:SAM-dependent methyltransferase